LLLLFGGISSRFKTLPCVTDQSRAGLNTVVLTTPTKAKQQVLRQKKPNKGILNFTEHNIKCNKPVTYLFLNPRFPEKAFFLPIKMPPFPKRIG